MSDDTKKVTVWGTILKIFSAIWDLISSRRRAEKQKRKKDQEHLKEVYNDLKGNYAEIDAKKEQQRKKDENVQDISNRLNNRF